MKKIFWAFDLSSYAPMDCFQVDCYVTSGLCIKIQLSGWTKNKLHCTPQIQTQTQKSSGSVCWSVTNVICCCFLDPSKTLTFEKVLNNLMRCIPKAAVSAAGTGQWEGSLFFITPTHVTQEHLNTWANWAATLASPTIFTWPLANQLPPFQASWQIIGRKTLPHPAEWRSLYSPRTQILTL